MNRCASGGSRSCGGLRRAAELTARLAGELSGLSSALRLAYDRAGREPASWDSLYRVWRDIRFRAPGLLASLEGRLLRAMELEGSCRGPGAARAVRALIELEECVLLAGDRIRAAMEDKDPACRPGPYFPPLPNAPDIREGFRRVTGRMADLRACLGAVSPAAGGGRPGPDGAPGFPGRLASALPRPARSTEPEAPAPGNPPREVSSGRDPGSQGQAGERKNCSPEGSRTAMD